MKYLSCFLILGLVSCLQSRPTYKRPDRASIDVAGQTKTQPETSTSERPESPKPDAPAPAPVPAPVDSPAQETPTQETPKQREPGQREPNKPAPEPAVPLLRKAFQNPIMSAGADPWVVEKDGWYYHCYADGNTSIYIRRARSLTDIEAAPSKRIWEAPPGKPYSKETWAPELHFLKGRWYVYFAADDGKDANHKMFVLESESQDPMGNYSLKAQIETDFWAIDGTILEGNDGKNFFVWSGWPTAPSQQQNIYVAPMKNPWTLEARSDFHQKIEAESAQVNRASVLSRKGASNGKLAGKIDFPESSVTFTVTAPSAGPYAIEVAAGAGFDGGGSHLISANGGPKTRIYYPKMGWDNRSVMTAKVDLNAGENKITLQKGDGYAELDYIVVKSYGKDPVLIAVPTYEWERRGGPPYVNEGPQILRRGDKVMAIYSGSGSWTNDYCLGQISLQGSDPMNSAAWEKVPEPVFQSANDVYGPGHASFVKTVDGKEDWIVYHAAKKKDSGWDRNVRIQSFSWKIDGSPDFGRPRSLQETLSFPFKE